METKLKAKLLLFDSRAVAKLHIQQSDSKQKLTCLTVAKHLEKNKNTEHRKRNVLWCWHCANGCCSHKWAVQVRRTKSHHSSERYSFCAIKIEKLQRTARMRSLNETIQYEIPLQLSQYAGNDTEM